MLFIDLKLARRLETCEARRRIEYTEAHRALRPSVGSAWEKIGDGYSFFCGARSPLNKTVGLGMNGPVTLAELEQVEDFYRRRNIPAQIYLCPLADNSLLQLLKERDYRLAEFLNVFVRSLDADDEAMLAPSEFEAVEAGPLDADLWTQTVAAGFAADEGELQECLEIIAPSFHMAGAKCFLARAGERVCGGGVLAIHDGLAELCTTSVLTEFRKRGVQAALIRARLDAARDARCDLMMVTTAPGNASQRNVERAGFRLAYTKAVLIRE
jgi:GNAT superfamily N-acetyltransferase